MTRTEIVESVVMLVCITSLWPVVHSMRTDQPLTPVYRMLLLVVVLALGYITVRRVRRMRAAFKDKVGGPGPPFPRQ